MSSPVKKPADVPSMSRRLGWRDVGYSWVAATLITALLLFSL